MTTRKQTILWLMLITLIIGLGISVFSRVNDVWVTSPNSQYCYPAGEEHGNVEYKIYYDSLSDCNKPINE